MVLAVLLHAAALFAQTDTVPTAPMSDSTPGQKGDTLRVGNFIIVKDPKHGTTPTNNDADSRIIVITRPHRHDTTYTNNNNVTTNWLVFDLGFANIDDRTNYSTANAGGYLHRQNGSEPPFTKNDLQLQTRSSNVNIWVFMQRLNITKHVLNLRYGLGLEMFNLRYENNISYHKSPAYIFRDSLDFSKNKLYTGYATIPLMVNINPWPNHKRLSLSFGASAGYLIGSHTKQISDERGKQKTRAGFDLDKWRLAYIGEVAAGPIRLYGSYSIQPLHQRDLVQHPYAVGVRFSSW